MSGESGVAALLRADLPPDPDPRMARLTLGHLLSMQAGLERQSGPNYGAWVASRNWVRAALAAPFPTKVRYTGASITFNFAGIFGASLAPYAATWLQKTYGLSHVGYYMLGAAVITLLCILASGREEV